VNPPRSGCAFDAGLIPCPDVALALSLFRKDGNDAITQDVLTTFSPDVLTDDNADHKGEMSCSLRLVQVGLKPPLDRSFNHTRTY
jgi:hypothetical protein